MQRADRLPRQPILVGGARLRQRVIGIEKRPRLDPRIGLAHARQTRGDVLLGRDHTLTNESRGVGGRQAVQVDQFHEPETSILRSRGPSNSSKTMR